MKLEKVWLVRDPYAFADPKASSLPEIVDVVSETHVDRLGDYAVGSGAGVWRAEHTALFTERDEAVAEGLRRLAAVYPDREGWFFDQAYREFGYADPRRPEKP